MGEGETHTRTQVYELNMLDLTLIDKKKKKHTRTQTPYLTFSVKSVLSRLLTVCGDTERVRTGAGR